MKSFLSRIESWIPRYAWLPLLLLAAMNPIGYQIPKLIIRNWDIPFVSTALDDALPLVPFFIYFYWLSYAQWIISYIVITRDNRELCFRFTGSVVLAKIIGASILLLYPTIMVRPTVQVTDFTTWLLKFTYDCDAPTTLFPSFHCLASWFCFRCSIGLRRTPRWYIWAQAVVTLLVFASVVLVKQHIWPDIIGGVVVAEAGILLNRILHLDRMIAKLDLSARSRV